MGVPHSPQKASVLWAPQDGHSSASGTTGFDEGGGGKGPRAGATGLAGRNAGITFFCNMTDLRLSDDRIFLPLPTARFVGGAFGGAGGGLSGNFLGVTVLVKPAAFFVGGCATTAALFFFFFSSSAIVELLLVTGVGLMVWVR